MPSLVIFALQQAVLLVLVKELGDGLELDPY